MKLTLIILVLLVSCGQKKESSKVPGPQERQDDLICAKSLACLPKVDWTIDSAAVNFPQKFRLTVNGSRLHDSCRSMGENATVTSRGSDRKLIKFTWPLIPKDSLFVEILDLLDCKATEGTHPVFVSDEHVVYSFATISTERGKYYSIHANLNN